MTACFWIKHLTTTGYHSQTSDKVKRVNITVAEHLRHFVAKHQTDWDQYLPTQRYIFNSYVHRLTGTMALRLVLSRRPLVLTMQTLPARFQIIWDNRYTARLVQLISAPAGCGTQAIERKSLEHSGTLEGQLGQHCPTHDVIISRTTRLFWQTCRMNDWISMHGQLNTAKYFSKSARGVRSNIYSVWYRHSGRE